MFDFLAKYDREDLIKSDEDIAKYEKEEEERKIEKAFRSWQEVSGIGKRYFAADIAKTFYEKEALSFLEKASGFLVLLGKAGVGKTYFACAILNKAKRGRYTTVHDIEESLHNLSLYSEKLLSYKRGSLLVIDEIGRGKNESEILYSILNARYSDNLPTILVSNLSPNEFAQHLGVSLIDRIAEDRILIEFTGDSRRKNEY